MAEDQSVLPEVSDPISRYETRSWIPMKRTTGKATGKVTTLDFSEQESRLQAAVFGYNVDIERLSHGLKAFYEYTRNFFAGPNFERYQALYLAVCHGSGAEITHDCAMEVALTVIHCLKESKNTGITINSVVDKLLRDKNVPSEELVNLRSLARQFVFTIIGAYSVIYQPFQPASQQSLPGQAFRLVRHDINLTSSFKIDLCQRPISALLREFGGIREHESQPRLTNAASHPPDYSDALNSSNISFSALRDSCGMTIEWINYADAHLTFDASSRTLYLFRYPAYFAAAFLGGEETFLADMMAMNHHGRTASRNEGLTVKCFAREMLQSYRLLFAQDQRSRGAFLKLRPKLQQEEWFDMFLTEICSADLKAVEKRYNGLRRELDIAGTIVYACEFRFIGGRLLELQKHAERHIPRKLRDLYRDRRDSEKYFTFWAVIWIGGASVVLSIVQVAIGIVQLVVAYHPPVQG